MIVVDIKRLVWEDLGLPCLSCTRKSGCWVLPWLVLEVVEAIDIEVELTRARLDGSPTDPRIAGELTLLGQRRSQFIQLKEESWQERDTGERCGPEVG